MTDDFNWPDFLPAFAREAEGRGFARQWLGTCPGGELLAWERPAAGPRVYLSGGIHGDEPAGPLALLELIRGGHLSQPDIHWLVCPALNPDGLANGIRENAGGIDLNRDYLTQQGPETIAHRAWIDARPAPELFLSFHEDWETRGFYFYEINLGEDDPARAARILEAVAPWFPPEAGPVIDGHHVRASGWIHHAAEPDLPEGWPEAIFLAKHGCPLSLTFETPSRSPLGARVAALVAAARAALES